MKNYFSNPKIAIFFSFLLLAILFVGTQTRAQSLSDNSDLNNLLSVDVSPLNPRAHDKVDISIQSFRFDLNRADIAWFINGDLQTSGIGKRNFSFTNGGSGTFTRVQMVIKPINGPIFDKTLTFAPADVDLVYQTSNYTPPFYKGKALYTYNSPVTVVALPNFIKEDGTVIPPEKLIYKWYTDTDNVFDKDSGYGKRTLSFQDELVMPQHIEVEVTAPEGGFKAYNYIDFEPAPPQVELYENNPLLGILFNKKISNLTLVGKEINLTAIPFFFSTKDKVNSIISYDWFVNNSPMPSQQDSPNITLRPEGDTGGTANVGVTIKNFIQEFQTANKNISITFGKKTSGLSF